MDRSYLGKCDRVQAPQRYDLGRLMTPGRHKISIECDNSPVRPLQFASYLPNGVTGSLYLEVTDPVSD